MSFNPLSIITGGIGDTIKSVASVFSPNKEAQSIRDSEARSATMGQYASEFNVHVNRTWFDSLVDGLNRLVRPIMAYSVMVFFGIVIYDTDLGLRVVQSLAIVPAGMWALLSIIVGFYFGSRHILKGKQFEINKAQFESAAKINELRKSNAETVTATEYKKAMDDNKNPLPNRVIAEWNKRNSG